MGEFNIRFREMNDSEFEKFFESSVSDYSLDLIKSGFCSEEVAFETAKKQFNDILPQGRSTENNFLNIVVNSKNEAVGIIWYNKYNEDMAYICDILINEEFRKKGYGRETLLLVENEAKEKGLCKILLHVFAFNKTAISLYSSLGYIVVKEDGGSIYMMKDI